jgi:hypothetical protein
MKRKYMTVIVIAIVILTIVFLVLKNQFTEKNTIRKVFNINIENVKLSEISKNEEWLPNGDGYKLMIFKYYDLNIKELSDSLDPLPVKESLPPNQFPLQTLNLQNGYYKLITDKNDERDFNLLIIDTFDKKIYVYYQVM